MVGVEVREKDVPQCEGHSVAHHLTLRSFATVEEKRLSFALDYYARNAPFDRRS
jgi:hypothetical protein